jgi:hypothetical protein
MIAALRDLDAAGGAEPALPDFRVERGENG